MAHDAEKLIARRERIVGQLPFMRKVFVRFLAFAPQRREMLRAFLAKDFVPRWLAPHEGLDLHEVSRA